MPCCLSCGNPLAPDADVRRLYCDQRCRSRAFRARDKAFRAAAYALVLRQSQAIRDRDDDALAQVERDAALLFA